MKIHAFGLATLAALLMSQPSAPLPNNNTATSAHQIDQALFIGDYLPVPYHEVYARDNVDTSWRQIMRSGFELFPCFVPYAGNFCDVNNFEQRSAF